MPNMKLSETNIQDKTEYLEDAIQKDNNGKLYQEKKNNFSVLSTSQ